MPHEALRLFSSAFDTAPRVAASAPGRVNLIGEHTDYNGGPVLPLAVQMRTVVAVGPADNGVLEVVSSQASPDARPQRIAWREAVPAGWGAYLVGVMRELWVAEAVPAGGGARVAVSSDVPIGAGLSSSAALTVAAAKALAAFASASLTPRQLAGVAFRAEHNHVGVRCGVMDQTVAALARRGHALLLECASLATRHVPFAARLLVVDTGVRRQLAQSEFNCRRDECEAAVTRLGVHPARRAGALGARLTGAGWGGSVIVLLRQRATLKDSLTVAGNVQRGAVAGGGVADAIRRTFQRKYGREPVITPVSAS